MVLRLFLYRMAGRRQDKCHHSGWWPSPQFQAARLRPSPSPVPVGQHTPSRPARASSGPYTSRAWAPGPMPLASFSASIRAGKAVLLVKTPPRTPTTAALLLKWKCLCDSSNYSLLCPTCWFDKLWRYTQQWSPRLRVRQQAGQDVTPGALLTTLLGLQDVHPAPALTQKAT